MAVVQEEPNTPIFRVMSSPEGTNNGMDGTINFIDETGIDNSHAANSVATTTTPPVSQMRRETINFIEEPAPVSTIAASTTPAVDKTKANAADEENSNMSVSYNILEVASSAQRTDRSPGTTAVKPSVTAMDQKDETATTNDNISSKKKRKTATPTTTTTPAGPAAAAAVVKTTPKTTLTRTAAATTTTTTTSNSGTATNTKRPAAAGGSAGGNAKAAVPKPPRVSRRAKAAEAVPHASPPPSAAPRTRTTASRNHRIVLTPSTKPPSSASASARMAVAATTNKAVATPPPPPPLPPVQPVVQQPPVQEEERKEEEGKKEVRQSAPAAALLPPPSEIAPAAILTTEVTPAPEAAQLRSAEKDEEVASEYSEAGGAEEEREKKTQLPGKIAAAAALAAVQHTSEQDLQTSDHLCVLPGTQWEVILQHSRVAVERTLVAEAAAATGLGPEYIRVTDLIATAKGLEAKLRIAHDPAALSGAKVDELLNGCTFENTLLLHTLRIAQAQKNAEAAEAMPPAPIIVAIPSSAASDAESAAEENKKEEEAEQEKQEGEENEEKNEEKEDEGAEPQPKEENAAAQATLATTSPTRRSLRPAAIESPAYSFTQRIGARRSGGHLSIRYTASPYEPKQRLELYFAAAPSHITGHFVRHCLAEQLHVKPHRLQLRCNAFDVHDDTTGAELHWHSGTILDAALRRRRTSLSNARAEVSESRPSVKGAAAAAATAAAESAAPLPGTQKREEEAAAVSHTATNTMNKATAAQPQQQSGAMTAQEQRRWLEHLTAPTASTKAKQVHKVIPSVEERNAVSARGQPRRARSISPRLRSHAPHREATQQKNGLEREGSAMGGGYTRNGKLIATARQPRRSGSDRPVPLLTLPHVTGGNAAAPAAQNDELHPGYLTPTESSRRKRTVLIEWERELPSELTVQRTYSVRTPRTAKEPAPLLLPPPNETSALTSRSHSRRLRSRHTSRANSTPYTFTVNNNNNNSNNSVNNNAASGRMNGNVYQSPSVPITRSHSRREGSRRSNGLNTSHTSRLSNPSHHTNTTFVHAVEPPQRVLRNVPATNLSLLLLRRAVVRPVMNAQPGEHSVSNGAAGSTPNGWVNGVANRQAAPLRLTPTERVGETRSVSRRSHSPHRQFPAAAASGALAHNATRQGSAPALLTQQHPQHEHVSMQNGNHIAGEGEHHAMNKAVPQVSYLHAVDEALIEAEEPAPERHAPNPSR